MKAVIKNKNRKNNSARTEREWPNFSLIRALSLYT